MEIDVITVDIGNSDAVVGLYNDNKLQYAARWNSKKNNTDDLVYELLNYELKHNNFKKFKEAKTAISCVVPELLEIYVRVLGKIGIKNVKIVKPQEQNFLKIEINNPSQLGTDLFINALMASSVFPSQNVVVVDFGTALTFTCLSADKQILGVLIFPGINTAIKSLFSDAAQLPRVELAIPNRVIGRNTEEAIQSGIVLGYEGLVNNILNKIKAEINAPVKTIATGGLSEYVQGFGLEFDLIDKNLTLSGLNFFAKN